MKISWACALALLVAQPGHAATATHTTYGAGSETCGDWTQARKASDWTTVNRMSSWVAGYLSATGRLVPMRDTDGGAINSYLDGFCQSHPLEAFEHATVTLVTELGGQ